MEKINNLNPNWLLDFGVIDINDFNQENQEGKKKQNSADEKLCKTCNNCGDKFSFLLVRPHRCGICRNYYCNSCIIKKLELGTSITKGIKICQKCFLLCKNFNEIIEKYFIKEKNTSFVEMKENYYCRTFDEYQYSCETFLEDEDEKFEQQLKMNINDVFNLIVKTLINFVLQKNFKEDEIKQKWKNTLYIILKETISNLRPCSSILNDSLDINNYIKIKTILYKDSSMTQVIQGYAITKNDKIKNLKTEVSNPKILLLNCGKIAESQNNVLNNQESKVLYSRLISSKLKAIRPDIIIIGKNFPKEVTKLLLQDNINNINIIYDLKNTTIKNISRCIKTIVLPSFNLIGANNILGSCKQFRYDNFQYENSNKDLLIFDGCNRLLYNTIILSGNDINILKKLKKLLKEVLLPTTRDLYLQQFLQYTFNMGIKPLPSEIDCEVEFIEELLETGNEITKLESNKCPQKKSKEFIQLSSISYDSDVKDLSNLFYEGFDMSIIEKKEDFNIYSLSLIVMSQKLNNNNESPNNKSLPKVNDEEITEKYILNNMSNYCEEPKDCNCSFFSSEYKYDKPLSVFLFDLCKKSKSICHSCNLQYSYHKFYLYKLNGAVTYSMIFNDENQLDKVILYLKKKTNIDYSKIIIIEENKKASFSQLAYSDIFTYGYCKKCQSIVTPLFKLSNEILNYSAIKFLRGILENHLSKNQTRNFCYNIKNLCSNPNCKHIINKEISRIFITRFGSWKFEYSDIMKYYIMPNNLNYSCKESSFSQKLFKKYLEEGYNNSMKIINIIQISIQEQVKFYQSLLTDEKMEIFFENINSLISLLLALQSFNDTYMISIVINKMLKENIEKYNEHHIKLLVSLRKIYKCLIKTWSIKKKLELLRMNFKTISDILNKIIPCSYKENLKIIENFKKEKQIEQQSKNNESTSTSINFEEDPAYISMVSLNNYTDNKHDFYSVDYNPDDISSVISNILASNSYLKLTKTKSGINLSKIKCERNSNDIVNKIITRNLFNDQRFSTISKLETKNKEEKIDTLLVFEQENQHFYIENKNISNDEILKILEDELTSTENDPEMANDLNNLKKKITQETYDKKNSSSKLIENGKTNNSKNKNIINENEDNKNDDKCESNSSNNLSTSPSGHNILIPEKQPDNIKEIKKKSVNYSKFNLYIKELTKQISDEKNKFVDLCKKLSEEIKSQNLSKAPKNNISTKIKYPNFSNDPELEKILQLKNNEALKNNKSVITNDQTTFDVRIFFAKQFEALRIAYCATTEEMITSLSKSIGWTDNSGGKSKATFIKTADERFVYKCIGESEFEMFIENIFSYFKYMSKFLFHKMPSALAKILGAYKIIEKSPNGKEKEYFLILMENIYYGLSTGSNVTNNKNGTNLKVYDLKGSRANRYIKKKDRKPGKVLLDTNFVEDFNREPLFIEENVFKKLKEALYNDSDFLSKSDVIDYSLLLVIDNNDKKENYEDENFFDLSQKKTDYKLIKLGIIDYCRKYTWDKVMESSGKSIIYTEKPTIIKPEDYSKRFKNEVGKYFAGI